MYNIYGRVFLLCQVRAIEEMLPAKRQNLMFSATIPSWVGEMAKTMMKDSLSVTVGEVCEEYE